MQDLQLHAEIKSRLLRDYTFKKDKGTWLQQGKCPSCGKQELFTNAANPWVLKCGRVEKCGAEYHVKDLYSDLFEKWSERYKATEAFPNAAADAYLSSGRGFDLRRIKGWYTQENFYNSELRMGSATVRFAITDKVWWERIIDQPERFGNQKANFRGSYKGLCWAPPNTVEVPDEVWFVEGIFDSIALLHHDIYAASLMSCVNYPAEFLNQLREAAKRAGKKPPKLVWALDAGTAGRAYTRKWVERSREDGWTATAAQPSRNIDERKPFDWNDLHQRGRLEARHIEEYRYNGALLVAPTATAKAQLIYSRKGRNSFSFEFDSRLYWFELDMGKYNKAFETAEKNSPEASREEWRDAALKESGSVVEIANCYPVALYYQANEITDESWYYFRIRFPHDGQVVKNTFTAAQLASASEFKKRMLGVAAGAVFTGQAWQLDIMIKRWLERIKVVQTVDYIGYSKEHKTWVFNDFAVSGGRVYELNDEDYFEVGRTAIKSLSRSVALTINNEVKHYKAPWLDLVWTSYRHKGIVALAYWMGALFAEQIRDEHKSLPFLEIVGEPGSGKTTLIEFMWRLVGREDYEGFDPQKSSVAARARNFSQVSNLPVVLLEGDRKEDEARFRQKNFDWDELKPLYNGRSVYSRGVKNGGNETYEPPFRAALIISQNAPVSASPATMQRICHITIDKSMHTPEGFAAGKQLETMDVKEVSAFILKVCMAEKEVLQTIAERKPFHEKRLAQLPDVRNQRLVLNHAQLAAMLDALKLVLPLTAQQMEESHAFIEDMLVERQEAINEDPPLVASFWEIYDHLNGDDEHPRLNHARKDDRVIAISLNHFVELAAEHRQQVPDMNELKKLLKTNRRHPFIDIKPVNSAIHARWNSHNPNATHPKPATVKCWVFKRGESRNDD